MLTNKLTRQLRRAVSVCSAVVLVVCSVPGQAKTSTPKVTEIKLTSPLTETGSRVSATLTMKKGSTFRIKTKLFPSSAKKVTLTYKSSKKKVATVSKKGVIKAKKTGKTTITVTPKGNKKVKAVIKVTVKKSLKKVKKIQLDQSTLTLSLGNNMNSANLIAKVTSPKKPTNKKIRWISEDSSVASVSKSGLVTAKKVGTTSVIAVAADGQGAKATCRVIVEQGNPDISASPAAPSGSTTPGVSTSGSPSPNTSASPGTVTSSPSQMPSTSSSASPSPTPAVINSIDIAVPDNRTGVKQGETLQLTAKNPDSGETVTDITWSTSSLTGVSISKSGLLSVTSEAETTLASPKKVSITATLNSKPEITDTVSLSVIENKSELTDNYIKLNEETAESPQGLSYRIADDGTKAYSTVIDPMRGSVTKMDEAIGYKNDMLAWLTVNPIYAGKTVHMSAYIKYDKLETRDTIGLVLNERFTGSYTNPASKWNAAPDTWHYVSGTFDLPNYRDYYYNDVRNYLYLSRFSELKDDEHPVYYLDNVVFSVEKADVEGVTLSSDDDTETIYQNHTRQYSAEVTGEKKPIQKVNYEIEPEVENVSISEDGLLTVGKAPANSVINLKASSIEDPEKYATREITVLAQTIDSLDVSAEGDVTEIYQDNELQFTAEVSTTGEADETVQWSISPEVSGAAISKDGLLTVGKVADGTELRITATSIFDPTKKTDYTVTVRENKVNSVTVKSAGDKTTISSDLPLTLFADVNVTGTPSKAVTWSIPTPVNGASISPSGNNCTLSINDSVAVGTKITVRAVSTFDPSNSGEITITVEAISSGEFSLDKCSVIYWQDFTGLSSSNITQTLEEEDVISWKKTIPDSSLWDTFSPTTASSSGGLLLTDTSLSASKRRTAGMDSVFGDSDDYLQFKLENTDSQDKAYTLSFMFRFKEIAIDSSNYSPTSSYKLPLQLISLDENDNPTILDNTIQIPYRCNATSTANNREFYNISTTVTVPADKTVRIQLKLNGDLPTCQSPSNHTDTGAESAPHPIVYTIDNVCVSNGNPSTINLKTNDTYELQLDTLSTDTVEYYTNCYMSQVSHTDKTITCPNFTTLPATVDENGVITASAPGDTALIAVITSADKTIKRKQCLIHVEDPD